MSSVHGSLGLRALHRLALAGGLLSLVSRADAQPETPPDGVTIGDFWFRPSVSLRVRGEYEHHAVETTASELPVLGTAPSHAPGPEHQWAVHERSRFGLSVERSWLSASLVVQDVRLAGYPSPTRVDRADPLAATHLHLAYIEARGPDRSGSFLRLGRQEVVWGDGRLIGVADWEPIARVLDAARAHWVLRNFDVEALAVLLSPPGSVPPELANQAAATGAIGSGSGAQLYGLSAALHLAPLLNAELFGLTRVARDPLPPSLTSSDVFVTAARVFGDHAGLEYAAEAAYQFGRFATADGHRRIAAWAAAVRAGWETKIGFPFKFEVLGSYASGDDGGSRGAAHRFDPILPDDRAGLGQMGLYAWSNFIDAGARFTLYPVEDALNVSLGYRYLRLADPAGAWFSAALVPIGQNTSNASPMLGHELDAAIEYSLTSALVVRAGYGALFTGAGARALLDPAASDQAPGVLSSAFLQAQLSAP
jgi:hypothetical protein